ncbi:MAG: signal recognition particle-docking protein FtsY [Proteobacteria bacterium]|nr:signal recognition particle-docking protein FtsY [Pseudomonadota bacterium]
MNENATWLGRLRRGLGRTSDKLKGGIAGLLAKGKLDQALLAELEEVLITADLGAATAARLTRSLAGNPRAADLDEGGVREALAAEIAQILAPVARPMTVDASRKPHVILVCGVNGSGKTTTIAKLAKRFADEGLSVVLAAGDTFRAAAVEQLQVWGERAGCPVFAGEPGADASGLAYDALEGARKDGADVLLIDTAGRLHNKADLMAELRKMVRALGKIDAGAPHDRVLVMDATIGQNAHAQVEAFRDSVDVTGLVLTKLDGSAKGGVLVALAERFALPVHAVGVGEGLHDMRPFEPRAFARSLLGLED